MENTALCYRQFGEPESVLQQESAIKATLQTGDLRVQMLMAPINASDLIPITGAYRHRITLPAMAGYEGVGRVVAAPKCAASLLGKRVLPLRGEGTWQQYVDCPATLAIPVPDTIADPLAARAFINPLAAWLMLSLYPPRGKRVLLTAAGSDCAILLGQWAQRQGATEVYGIHRSAVHADRLRAMGIVPVAQQENDRVRAIAAASDIVYDATGGELALTLLGAMEKSAQFICYGLLSGEPFALQRHFAPVRWFHIRNYLDALSPQAWQSTFREIWPLLAASQYSGTTLVPFTDWQTALASYRQAGRTCKPVLDFASL
ncbi:zinc-dependent alcohol dehydrogenase family protein [Leclercia adecarboxylata]|uniref:zinc-dependent alcohol dehydrogenase family protein n=1 Tax=Leclercia adecarboxylata TaxID=83655 RepID=UPI002DB64933|nr:zinc-dependent alcohol dehydrogenase family protein [Leclercia adecarboxylata]MEB6377479.1 zinc-dependent alcohol dehydrogenase family protein [Leclercia adecarboxylata]